MRFRLYSIRAYSALLCWLPIAGIAADINSELTATSERLTTRMQDFISFLPLLGIAILVILLFWWLSSILKRSNWLYRKIRNGMLRALIRQLVQTVVLGMGLLIALEVVNAMALAGAVLGTAGVVGLALGFAFKDVVENYLAGLLLSMRQPFDRNDFICVDGYSGKVLRLNSRATILMTLDGNHIRIPNATVFKSSLTNYTRNPLRRFDFAIGIEAGEDFHQVQQLGLETLRNMQSTLDDPAPWSALEPPGDSNIEVRFYAWVNQSSTDFTQARSEAIRLVVATLADAGVDMPEPIYRINLPDAPAMTDVAADASEKSDHTDRQSRKKTRHKTVSKDTAAEQPSPAQDDIDNQIAAEERQHKAAQDEPQDLLNQDSVQE